MIYKWFIPLLLTMVSINFSIPSCNRAVLSLTDQEITKLDPRLHAVIAQEVPNLRIAQTTVPQVDALAVNEDGEKIYAVIVHTSEPDIIRTAGIQVNSMLPNFITTRVTALDMVTLVKLNAVKYIDAGDQLFPLK